MLASYIEFILLINNSINLDDTIEIKLKKVNYIGEMNNYLRKNNFGCLCLYILFKPHGFMESQTLQSI